MIDSSRNKKILRKKIRKKIQKNSEKIVKYFQAMFTFYVDSPIVFTPEG